MTALAIFALHHEDIPDPWSRPVWGVLERASCVATILILAIAATDEMKWKRVRWSIVSVWALLSCLFAIVPSRGHGPWGGAFSVSDNTRTAVSLIPLGLFA